MIKPFRKSVISGKKFPTELIKGKTYGKKVKIREELAREAGSSGFSARQMEKKLKELGHNPTRRKEIVSHILGGKNSPELSLEGIKKMKKEKETQKRITIFLGKEAAKKEYIGAKGAWYKNDKDKTAANQKADVAQKGIVNLERGSSAKDLGIQGVEKVVGHFALGAIKNEKRDLNGISSKTDSRPIGLVDTALNKPSADGHAASLPKSINPAPLRGGISGSRRKI